jgi:hypothetical protein
MSFSKIRFEGLSMNLEKNLVVRNKVLRFGRCPICPNFTG